MRAYSVPSFSITAVKECSHQSRKISAARRSTGSHPSRNADVGSVTPGVVAVIIAGQPANPSTWGPGVDRGSCYPPRHGFHHRPPDLGT